MTLAWIDIETTGLDPQRNQILEVACIITTDDFTEVAGLSWVLQFNKKDFDIDEVVTKMHTDNGLWDECAKSIITCDVVDQELAAFIQQQADVMKPEDKPQLAGSTISFDRAFIESQMPHTKTMLHYRNLDVTTLNEVARRFWPVLYEGRPKEEKQHRAVSDIEHSIATAKYYVQNLNSNPSTGQISRWLRMLSE